MVVAKSILTTKFKVVDSKGEALHRQLQAFATQDTCDRLTDIQATTLIIAGDKDVAIPRSNSDVLATQIPNVKLEIIADAAHGFSYGRLLSV
jgi:3-oxoadipate enol-lactonase